MEFWDAYRRDFTRLENVTLVRGEKIPEGAYHLVSDVIVRHTDGTYLLMQRDKRKHFGGLWEATAGGSALQGEDARSCAVRELREETGIEAETITELGRVIDDRSQTLYVEFLCITGCAKHSVTLQEGETSAYRWVGRAELISMKKDELVTHRIQRFVDDLIPARIREYGEFRPEEVIRLYRSVGWTNYTERADMLREAYENSLCALGAYDQDRLVGLIRAVGDGVSIVFVQDILVLPEYQRRGVGTALLKAMTDRYRTVYQTELLTDRTEKTETFYRSAGFVPADEIGCMAFVRM